MFIPTISHYPCCLTKQPCPLSAEHHLCFVFTRYSFFHLGHQLALSFILKSQRFGET